MKRLGKMLVLMLIVLSIVASLICCGGQAGADGTDGVNGTNGVDGNNGTDGKDGTDGVSAYVGFDGYIWNGAERTQFKADATLAEGVVENTLGIEGEMSKYFKGEYISTQSKHIAVMTEYRRYSNVTQYGGQTINQIKLVVKDASILKIGVAKVSDIANARLFGSALSVTNIKTANLTSGINLIDVNATIAQDKTLVLGGSGSDAKLYFAKGIDTDSKDGNFAVVDNTTHSTVLNMTNDIADRLAIQVKVEGIANAKQIFSNMQNDYNNIGALSGVVGSLAPFAYKTNYFGGKQIVKIGIPVMSVAALDDNQTFTYYVVNANAENYTSGYVSENTVMLPREQLGDSTTVNKWVYVDVDVTLTSNQTLAFGKSTDTVVWGYYGTRMEQFDFYLNNKTDGNASIFFDVYEKGASSSWKEHIEGLDDKEIVAMLSGLGKKKISFLGDSITTYEGISNGTSVNNTLGNNAVWYNGSNADITSPEQTWWKQSVNELGLELLVNNAWSGGWVYGEDNDGQSGVSRAMQLHDNTLSNNPNNQPINPDIIAVYLGTNDCTGGCIELRNQTTTVEVWTASFRNSYTRMINNISSTYANADVYLFTLLPSENNNDNELLHRMNDVIRETAEQKGYTVVDLYANSGLTMSNIFSYTCEGTHPKQAGMDKITDCFVNTLKAKYLGK